MHTTRVLVQYASLARVLVLCQVPSAPDEEEDLVTPPLALLAPVSLSSSDIYDRSICLSNVNNSLHNENKVLPFPPSTSSKTLSPPLISGSTYWINEFMAVGHVMYDIQLLG